MLSFFERVMSSSRRNIEIDLEVCVWTNDQVLQVIYRLPAGAQEGTYSFGGIVSGRAFSPNDGAGYAAVPPWQYDPDSVHIYPSVAFSVFNAAP